MKRLEGIEFYTNKREIYRYLGYKGSRVPDETIRSLIDECMADLEKYAEPRGVYRIDPLVFSTPSDFILSGIPVHSEYLGKNLAGCERSVLIAATLSSSVDRLISKASRLEITKAVILQAAAAAMVESYLDAAEEMIRDLVSAEGCDLRPRFSPGFGDFTTAYQKPVLDALLATKLLGITFAGDSEMMLPTKSVTAVIGICRK